MNGFELYNNFICGSCEKYDHEKSKDKLTSLVLQVILIEDLFNFFYDFVCFLFSFLYRILNGLW